MSVDLHLHTNASDGSLSPVELVKKAIELNYKAIAITDHDTIDGLKPALKVSQNTLLEIIPGIEINTDFKKHEVHILGYFIDYQAPILTKKLNYLMEMRVDRARKMLTRLKKMGVKIEWKNILDRTKGNIIGRSHIAREMIDSGYVDSWDEAFNNYIGLEAPAYVPRDRLTPGQAINLIKKAGGLPVLAHPGLINNDQIVKEIINRGLKGLEVHYYEHTEREIEKYKTMAFNHNLVITGGSDCHGPGNKDGLRLGKVRLNYSIVEEMKEIKQ